MCPGARGSRRRSVSGPGRAGPADGARHSPFAVATVALTATGAAIASLVVAARVADPAAVGGRRMAARGRVALGRGPGRGDVTAS